MVPNLGLTTRATDIAGEAASLQLGGVILYAATASALQEGVEAIADAISRSCAAHLSLTRDNLVSEVKELLGVIIDKRIFGSILGQQLRLGMLDCIPCAATSGKAFRIYVHQKRNDEFVSYIRIAADQLQRTGVLEVRDLQMRLFGSRKWGAWSSAAHVLARLVQKGKARYQDSGTFLWQTGVEHAVRQS